MHFYNFNINDFNATTRHLNHLERALYRDLIDMYYQDEKPITSNLPQLERKLLVKTDDEKQALQNVLTDFFVVKKLKGDSEPCYHNARIDRELKNYKHRQTLANKHQTSSNAITNENQTPSNENQTLDDRQSKHKNKVAFLVKSLKDKGINANTRMKIGELQTLFDEHCKQTSNAITNENQTPSNADKQNQTAFGQSISNNQEPITKNQNIKNKYQSEIAQVFDFWKSVFGKADSTILSEKRKSKIIERLKDGYTVEQIKQAIYNCSKSEFHVSGNHTDLELICRNIEKLDYFLGLTEQIRLQQTGKTHANNQSSFSNHAKQPTTAEYAKNLEAGLQRYIEQRRAERTINHGDWTDVHPMEAVV